VSAWGAQSGGDIIDEILAIPKGASETHAPLAHIQQKTLQRVRHFLVATESRVYRDLKGMCEGVSKSYRDRAVLELLQNAHDAHTPDSRDGRIHITLNPGEGAHGTLYVANDGNVFTQENFDALCSPTLTTKNVNEAIGNKGVGFLSVFQVSSHPEVYSRRTAASLTFDGFCFVFAADEMLRAFLDDARLGDKAAQVIESMPRLYLACPATLLPAAVQQLAAEGFATVVRLPLKNKDALAAVRRQLTQLSAETPPVQLFLSRIKELRISANPSKAAILLERHCEELKEWHDTRILKTHCGTRSFIVAEKTIPHSAMLEVIGRDIAAETLPKEWGEWTGDAIVSTAVAASGEPLEPRLYNFLPMGEEAKAPFAGYLDAPFFATLDRLGVQEGVEVNTFLLETARQLTLDAADIARTCLPRSEARQAVLDLVLWSKNDAPMRERVLASTLPLIPTIRVPSISEGWGTLGQTRLWQGDAFLSPHLVARHAGFPIVDPELDLRRMGTLRSFVEGTGMLDCPASDRAEIVEQVAKGLSRVPCDLNQWNQFYRSLAELFSNDAVALSRPSNSWPQR
jgi:hypothetical protein